jgi:hypothetical protein
MAEVVYRSRARIEKKDGPLRFAYLPAHPDPVPFGVHGDVARYYGREGGPENTTTLDYVVAAAGG